MKMLKSIELYNITWCLRIYHISFFKFALVLNALDNRAARSHVNRMCLAADVPLVESGTAGYLGQVNAVHLVFLTKIHEYYYIHVYFRAKLTNITIFKGHRHQKRDN